MDINTPNSVFDAVFMDDIDSEHNDMFQNGSLQFFLDEIGYEIDDAAPSICEYLELQYAVIVSSPIFNGPIEPIYMEWENGASLSAENEPILDLVDCSDYYSTIIPTNDNGQIITEDDGSVKTSPMDKSISIVSADRGCAGIEVELIDNQIRVSGSPDPSLHPDDYCTEIEIAICITNVFCPDFEVCQNVTIPLQIPNLYDFEPLTMQIADGNKLQEEHLHATNANCTRPEIFPNPAKDFLTLTGIKDNSSVKIYDTFGRDCFSKRNNSSKMVIDLAHLPKGVYFIYISDNSQVETIEKIVIN